MPQEFVIFRKSCRIFSLRKHKAYVSGGEKARRTFTVGFLLRSPRPLLLLYQNARLDADRTENNFLVPSENPSFVLCWVIIFIQPPGRFFLASFSNGRLPVQMDGRYNCRFWIFNQPPGRSFFCFLFKFWFLESVSWKSADVVLNRTNFSRKTIYWKKPKRGTEIYRYSSMICYL